MNKNKISTNTSMHLAILPMIWNLHEKKGSSILPSTVQSIMCNINYLIHLSVWVMVSSGPGDVLTGGTISAAEGGVLPSVTLWSCSEVLVGFWAETQGEDSGVSGASASAERRKQENNNFNIKISHGKTNG